MRYFMFLWLLFLTACFEIKEEIELKANGSGKYTLLLDLSQSQEIISKALEKDKKLERTIPNFDSTLVEGAKRLNEIKGIKNAKGILNANRTHVGMSFEFESIKALNEALNENNESDSAVVVYWLDKNVLTRNNEFHLRRLLPMDAEAAQFKKMEELLQQGSYVWTLKSAKIKKSKNEAYQIGKDKSTVEFRTKILELLQHKAHIENEIKFKGL